MFVCRAWSSVAYKEFHEVLTLNKKNIEIMSPLWLERHFDQWFQGAWYVKELKMHCKVSALHRPPTFDLFTVFLSYLPNLKEIYLSSFKQFEGGYARLLTPAADSQQCLQPIQKVNVQDVMLQMRYYERNLVIRYIFQPTTSCAKVSPTSLSNVLILIVVIGTLP